MSEIYLEYLKNTNMLNVSNFKPEFKVYTPQKSFEEISEKYSIYFNDFEWKKDSVLKNTDSDSIKVSILNGEILPKEKRFNPEDTENIEYGSFNIINIDENFIKIYNDIFSMLPLFYYQDQDIFIISSKMKPIIERLKSLNKQLTEDEVGKYLSASSGYMIGDYTFFKGIKYLRQGRKITIDLKTDDIIFSKYYTYNYSKKYKKENISEDKFNEIFDIFDKSQEKLIQNYSEDAGLMISGGLDSRYILAQMERVGVSPKLINMGHKNSAEVIFAKEAVEISGNSKNLDVVELTEKDVVENAEDYYKITEGFERSQIYHTIVNYKKWLLQNNVKYLYNGYFGDCVLGGTLYSRLDFDPKSLFEQVFYLTDLADEIKTREDCIRRILKNLGASREKALKQKYDGFKEVNLRNIVEKEIDIIMDEINYETYMDVYLHFQFLTRAHRHVLYCTLTSRAFTEFIHPFFAYRMFETALQIDDKIKTQHELYKKYLIDRFPKYAKITKSGWGFNCYHDDKVCRAGEYFQAFKNKVIERINNGFKKSLIKKDTYYDPIYWYYSSEEFRNFLDNDLKNGFIDRHVKNIEKYYNIKYE
ncbi:asparagine synthase-related protein [Methanococcus voltae]|uniref:asparagine synthase-related protein n=1 Tax=Methanococcus voltae TaxID=2188 RepID=UPI001AE3CC00|nr:asparagine synthase-related protein [Methanococcus voltae]MBP2172659.1 asparagine synthetase B (glutamine-hydrolyzing) [Methanococcus voltae]